MKKGVIILVAIGLILSGALPAHAYRYPAYHHHHYPHWGAFGVGIITGAIIADLFYGPPARTVIVQPAPPIVVQTPPVIGRQTYAPPYPSAPVGNWVSVTAQILNVRSGPGMNFAVIGRVYQGDLLFTQGTAPQWIYVRLPDGNFGWVMAEFTTQTSSPASG